MAALLAGLCTASLRKKCCPDVGGHAGPEVSAAVGADGRTWLWGMGTNGQLGNGNDDLDRETPNLVKSKALQGKRIVQASGPSLLAFYGSQLRSAVH